ncbi:ESX secretion-associated protein EspG [Nocardia ignorata]|uniref:ESAT-6 protein secretion system EspG family protein n=1 Tax=Nocardia ignorata TaxID=145285 RepID=A0A4R6PNC9_NOCIG|nr:ESX secretion-associated protein EspG [Nocardia ignorata]TDP39784.1 ESAT-6 protein secretion system EspG family protein [Nocardia ignorata]
MTTLTNDALLAVADRLGVQTLPLTLRVGLQQDSYEQWRRAHEQAVADLRDSGLIDAEGEVDPGLADALFVLAQPDRELAVRIYAEDGTKRVCVVRRGGAHAIAVRTDDTFEVNSVWCDGSAEELARPVLAALGHREPAQFSGFSAPADELTRRLDGATTAAEFADGLYALDATERDATVLGAAFASCTGHAEIVVYSHEDGSTTRAPGAVAVYDTGRGRIVAAPTISPDRQIWSTLTTGTDHRVTQAVAALIEGLPGGRWMPP